MKEKQIYYFDHNATTPIDNEVFKAVVPYYEQLYGNPSSSYYIGRQVRDKIENVRSSIASYFNMNPEGVMFTSSGSEADNMIIKGIALGNKNLGNHIITTKIEHPAVLNTCKFLENNGFEVTYLDVKENGIIDTQELKNAIKDNTILISIMYANNEIGTIQPIQEIGQIAKEKGIIFHTDAVQAIGEIRIDVQKLNIDCMSISGHKIYAPKGIGMAYIKPGIKFEPLIHGGSQEFHFRAGTENVIGIIALGKAIELLDKNIENNNEKLIDLKSYILNKIQNNLTDYIINGDIDKRTLNNINLSFKDIDGESLLLALDLDGICVSSGSACHSDSMEPSHVLRAIGVPNDYISGTLRISFGKNTTKKEIDYLIEKIKEKIDFIKGIKNTKTKGVGLCKYLV